MMKILLFAIMVMLLFLVACENTAPYSPDSSINQKSDDLTVRLEIQYNSPNTPNTEVIIENNTLVVKDYWRNQTKDLAEQDFEHLKRTIINNEFFFLPESEGTACSDCIVFSITVNRDNQPHTVTCHNYDSCSVQFNNIKREIVLLWEYGNFNWPLPPPTENLTRAYHPMGGKLLHNSIPEEKEIMQSMNVRLECLDGSQAERIEVVNMQDCFDCYQEWVIDCPNDNQFLVVVSEETSRGGFFLFAGRSFS